MGKTVPCAEIVMSALPVTVVHQSLSELQAAFLSMRPRILTHARIYFRDIPCREHRADCEAEVVALCWKWFCRLAQRGKDAERFVSTLATYAARAVRSGRRLCGQLKPNDVLSETAQKKRGFRVEALPMSTRKSLENVYGIAGSQRRVDVLEERLTDNMQTPVPDQAAFRCDFPVWLGTWSERYRRIIQDMARDERTSNLARRYNLSRGRISQLRRQFHDDWQRFCADPGPRNSKAPTSHAAVLA